MELYRGERDKFGFTRPRPSQWEGGGGLSTSGNGTHKSPTRYPGTIPKTQEGQVGHCKTLLRSLVVLLQG